MTTLGIHGEKAPLKITFPAAAEMTKTEFYEFPDAAWIRLTRWQALTPEEQAAFAPICPDFVVELRSARASVQNIKVPGF